MSRVEKTGSSKSEVVCMQSAKSSRRMLWWAVVIVLMMEEEEEKAEGIRNKRQLSKYVQGQRTLGQSNMRQSEGEAIWTVEWYRVAAVLWQRESG